MAIITDEKILRTPCEDVHQDEVKDLISTLENELFNYERLGNGKAIGLACPQIGIHKKAAIVRIDPKYSVNLINAHIEKSYDPFTFEGEGCLSFPGMLAKTKRFNEIYVINETFPYSFIATGLFAVCVSHELDHLQGRLLPELAIIDKPKPKPHELCHCGSNRKYKKCCLPKEINAQ